MRKITVAVLFGGMSSEHDVSKLSAATVINNLSPEKYFVIPVYITKEGKWMFYDGNIDNLAAIQWDKQGTPAVLSPDATHRGLLRIAGAKVKVIPVDIVFPVLHGKYGEDGSVQGLCELAGLPYVGAGILASAACMDKTFTKTIVKTLGILQAEHLTFKTADVENNIGEIYKKTRYKIGYPCFVKPANAGSSIGISKVAKKEDLLQALKEAAMIDDKIIIEKAVAGRELECAVLGGDEPEVSGVGEIIPSAEFYDYDAKYGDTGSQTIISPDLPDDIRESVRSSAAAVYKALDCDGMARVDFFYDETKNKIIFNEINTIPGFTGISMYPMLWKAAGVGLPALVDKLIEFGLRKAGKYEL